MQWRDRLVNALKEIKVGKSTGQAANEISDNNGSAEWTSDSHVAQMHEVFSFISWLCLKTSIQEEKHLK